MDISFKPLDLSKGVVNVLFKNCLSKSADKLNLEVLLFSKQFGYPEDSDPVYFDIDCLNLHKPMIYYVLGQLEGTHNSSHPS